MTMTATRTKSTPVRRFDTVATEPSIRRAVSALEANGMTVLRAPDGAAARRIVLDLIPEGASVHHGASQTLDVIGITDALETSGRYQDLRSRARTMDRRTEGEEIRRLTAAPDVMLGSVHAVTETGSLLTASSSGSQLAAYAAGAGRLLLVVGTQKIVADVDEGLRRIEDYSFPLEDARALEAYGIHSSISKVLIVNREIVPERITVILVDEVLGF